MNKEDFIEIYKGVENDGMPSICGRSFSAAQYADLADLIFSRMKEMNYYPFLFRYVKWVNDIVRSRKEKRFYQDFLHSYYISKSVPIINDSESEKESKYRKVEITSHQFYQKGWFHGYANIYGGTYVMVEDESGQVKNYNLEHYTIKFLEPLKEEQ